MRFNGRTILISALAASYCAAIPPSNACTIFADTMEIIGPNGKPRPETSAERERRERTYAKAAIKKNEKAAKKLLANGTVDVSADLARLLIPNVRSEDDGTRSSCGPWDGQDIATKNDSIIQDKDFQRAIIGDPFEPKLMEYHRNRPEKFYIFHYFSYPAKQCNTEFRDRFKAFLLSRHSTEELGNIWLFLKSRNRVYQPASLLPIRVFNSDDRSTPPYWTYAIGETAFDQLKKWDAKPKGDGSKLKNTLTEFWAQQGPLLNDSWAVCPDAMNNWKPAQDPDNERIMKRIMAKTG